jgi:AcrR family transcriptional regulator
MPRTDTIRTKIIDAARRRIGRYGYCKTTMAELAADCGMSPGNLYRYFPGKLDIAAEIARNAFDETIAALRAVVRQPQSSAKQRLRDFLFTELHVTYEQLHHDEKIHDVAEIIKQERPEAANENLARSRSLLVEILSMGNASGELDVPNVVDAAEMIQCATMKFRYPQLFSQLPLDALERELEGVIELLLRGIAGKQPAQPPSQVSA